MRKRRDTGAVGFARARAYVDGMTQSTINVAILIAMGVVLAVLIAGVVNLVLTGDKARSRSNLLMRWRVAAQFIAVILLMAGFWLKSRAQ
jgi:hypothetical protein